MSDPATPANVRSLEALSVGQVERFTVTLTPEDIDRFADLSGDAAPLHMDAAFAARQGYPGRVAHGLLAGALVSRLVGMQLPGALGILQSVELRFKHPIVPPVKVTVTGEIVGISVAVRQVQIRIEVTDLSGTVLVDGRVRSVMGEG